MRAYAPVTMMQADELLTSGQLIGPLPAWGVDPQWRSGSPEVSEEEWEYEAAALAAAALGQDPGVVLAVETEAVVASGGQPAFDDGRVTLIGPVPLATVAAVLTADLAWFGVQELAELIAAG